MSATLQVTWLHSVGGWISMICKYDIGQAHYSMLCASAVACCRCADARAPCYKAVYDISGFKNLPLQSPRSCCHVTSHTGISHRAELPSQIWQMEVPITRALEITPMYQRRYTHQHHTRWCYRCTTPTLVL